MTEAETGKRPKPIELVARAIYDANEPLSGDSIGTVIVCSEHLFPSAEHQHGNSQSKAYQLAAMAICRTAAQAAFDILIKHGCISIEGIIARDEELARGAPVPERAGDE